MIEKIEQQRSSTKKNDKESNPVAVIREEFTQPVQLSGQRGSRICRPGKWSMKAAWEMLANPANASVTPPLALFSALLLLSSPIQASDLVRLTGSAANEGAGGLIGLDPNPQTAILANPALLSGMADGIDFTLTGLRVNSDFTSQLGEVAPADPGPGFLPELGMKGTLGSDRWSWGGRLYRAVSPAS